METKGDIEQLGDKIGDTIVDKVLFQGVQILCRSHAHAHAQNVICCLFTDSNKLVSE
jgi:hypothetical protein